MLSQRGHNYCFAYGKQLIGFYRYIFCSKAKADCFHTEVSCISQMKRLQGSAGSSACKIKEKKSTNSNTIKEQF